MSNADHVKGLEEKVKNQAQAIQSMRTVEDFRKRQLDALHYVWCSGGCEDGIHRFGDHPPLTAQLVDDALGCVRRMAEKLRAMDYRAGYPNGYATLTAKQVAHYKTIIELLSKRCQ